MALSVPAVITNVTTPLLALCDVAIVGHMGGATYIAAIAVGGTMFNMLYWLCGFLRMGSSGTTAQALGAGNMAEAYAICFRGLVMASIMGMLFILVRYPLCEVFLNFIGPDRATDALVTEYFHILIWGAPAMLATYVFTGWFLGMQDSRTPMWISILINVVNIASSLCFVYVFDLGIEGVALGTLCAQWTGALTAASAMFKKFGWHRTDRATLLRPEAIRRFFRINSDIFLRTLCLVAVTVWFTRTGASQGTLMLAVNTLLMQLFTIFSYMMDGVAYAGEALCGKYLGAGDRAGLNRTIRALLRTGLVGSVVFTVAYFVGGDAFLHMLSDDAEVVNRSREYFGWALSIPLIGFAAFVWDGVMIGITRTRAMLVSMAVGASMFFGLYFILFPSMGNHGLWVAFLSYLLCRGVTLWIVGRRYLQGDSR